MYLPCGTSNDLYEGYGGNNNNYKAKLYYVEQMLRKTVLFRQVDTGYVKYINQDGQEMYRAFNGQFSVGAGAKCALNAYKYHLLGKNKYYMSGLAEVARKEEYKV